VAYENIFSELNKNINFLNSSQMTPSVLADMTRWGWRNWYWSVALVQIEQTPLPGLLVLKPKRFGDDRGFFSETWNARQMEAAGLAYPFVQDNHSLSAAVGTLRGLHCQVNPHAQAKLVRCGRGRLFDVAVDARRGSPTFGQWYGRDLSFENGLQLMIPAGFLHGFVTREPDTEIVYKCSDFYAPEADRSVRFDDPEIGIDWGLGTTQPILSQKDADAPGFGEFDHNFVFEEA